VGGSIRRNSTKARCRELSARMAGPYSPHSLPPCDVWSLPSAPLPHVVDVHAIQAKKLVHFDNAINERTSVGVATPRTFLFLGFNLPAASNWQQVEFLAVVRWLDAVTLSESRVRQGYERDP